MITSNVPNGNEQRLFYENEQFKLGDRVRVLLDNKSEYIGKIYAIFCDTFFINTKIDTDIVSFSKVAKIRIAPNDETLDTIPFFDEEEKEFWRTHIHSRDGFRLRNENEKVNW